MFLSGASHVVMKNYRHNKISSCGIMKMWWKVFDGSFLEELKLFFMWS